MHRSITLPLIFLLVAASFAQQSVADLNTLDAHACADLAPVYVRARLNLWQQRFKLQDWQITLVMTHRNGLKPGTLGNIQWYSGRKVAVLHVLDASDYSLGCQAMLNDMEFTVVHELIHVELSSLRASDANRSEEEDAINQITSTMLALDRRN